MQVWVGKYNVTIMRKALSLVKVVLIKQPVINNNKFSNLIINYKHWVLIYKVTWNWVYLEINVNLK